jgi:hypothetical protein
VAAASAIAVRATCAQAGEERIAPELWDHHDPQGLLPSQHRAPSLGGASNVYCVLECWGGTFCASSEAEPLMLTTRPVTGNGLNPSWDEGVVWKLSQPNAAFVRLSVYHRGVLKDEMLGTEVLPVGALRDGYRSIHLRTAKGLRLQLAAVLLKIRVTPTESSRRLSACAESARDGHADSRRPARPLPLPGAMCTAKI